MKLFIATQEEPFYLPLYFQKLFKLIKGRHEVVGANVLEPFNTQSNWIDVFRDYWGMYGPVEFFRMGTLFAWHKVANVLQIGNRPHSVATVMNKNQVPMHGVRKQNTDEFLKLIDADVFVSVANPIIVRKRLIEHPPKGCINFHAGYLPRYRGVNPSFWSLLNGEAETAITVHYIDEKVDNGPIIRQQPIPIETGETLDSLFVKVITLGPELMAKALDDLESGNVVTLPNDESKATYFGFPTPEDGKRFRKKGMKFR